MRASPPRNIQSGVPVAASASSGPIVSPADQHDGHYEPSAEQVVKVVHQVKPTALPPQGPTDFEVHGGSQPERQVDVRVTPEEASVWEALPAEPRDE